MAQFRLPRILLVCLAVAGLAVSATACGEDVGTEETPAREGLALDVSGVDYNIFITRELNLRITPDRAYYSGPPAARNKVLYGMFLQACGASKKRVRTIPPENFVIEDNQGHRFLPKSLPESNPFAYKSTMVSEQQCEPQPGSVAQQGPTAGSLLIYEFPLQDAENRPLQLHIEGKYDLLTNRRESKIVDLDL